MSLCCINTRAKHFRGQTDECGLTLCSNGSFCHLYFSLISPCLLNKSFIAILCKPNSWKLQRKIRSKQLFVSPFGDSLWNMDGCATKCLNYGKILHQPQCPMYFSIHLPFSLTAPYVAPMVKSNIVLTYVSDSNAAKC